jgi:large subunit ribosomal protein L4
VHPRESNDRIFDVFLGILAFGLIGGKAHGPVYRDHSTELQLKVREMGIRSALSAKYQADQLTLTTTIENKAIEPKSKILSEILNQNYPPLSQPGLALASNHQGRNYSSILIVAGIDKIPHTLGLAARNLPDVKVIPVNKINVYDILLHEHLVLDNMARKWLEWRLKVE